MSKSRVEEILQYGIDGTPYKEVEEPLKSRVEKLLEQLVGIIQNGGGGGGTGPSPSIIIDSALSKTSTNPVQNKVITAALEEKAPIDSPVLTGTPEAPTPTDLTTDTDQIATTAFVQAVVELLVDGAPENLNTLNELAEALAEIDKKAVQSDWNVTSTSSPAYILNKPDLSNLTTPINTSTISGSVLKSESIFGKVWGTSEDEDEPGWRNVDHITTTEKGEQVLNHPETFRNNQNLRVAFIRPEITKEFGPKEETTLLGGLVLSFAYGNASAFQLYFSLDTEKFYYRMRPGSSEWKEWKEIITSSIYKLNTKDDAGIVAAGNEGHNGEAWVLDFKYNSDIGEYEDQSPAWGYPKKLSMNGVDDYYTRDNHTFHVYEKYRKDMKLTTDENDIRYCIVINMIESTSSFGSSQLILDYQSEKPGVYYRFEIEDPEDPYESVYSEPKRLAYDSDIDKAIADLIDGAPETLDTLNELAAAIKDNQDVIDALNQAIANKVDKVEGKGLSTNDFTDADKEAVNTQPDWNVTSVTSPAYILHKPDLTQYERVQADWSITSTTSPAYIQNKKYKGNPNEDDLVKHPGTEMDSSTQLFINSLKMYGIDITNPIPDWQYPKLLEVLNLNQIPNTILSKISAFTVSYALRNTFKDSGIESPGFLFNGVSPNEDKNRIQIFVADGMPFFNGDDIERPYDIYLRVSDSDGQWKDWKKIITSEDLSEYLPLSGGKFDTDGVTWDIDGFGLFGTGVQDIENFDTIKAKNIKGDKLYYAMEDTDERYYKTENGLPVNTSTVSGAVLASAEYPNKVWGTDENGEPGWIELTGGVSEDYLPLAGGRMDTDAAVIFNNSSNKETIKLDGASGTVKTSSWLRPFGFYPYNDTLPVSFDGTNSTIGFSHRPSVNGVRDFIYGQHECGVGKNQYTFIGDVGTDENVFAAVYDDGDETEPKYTTYLTPYGLRMSCDSLDSDIKNRYTDYDTAYLCDGIRTNTGYFGIIVGSDRSGITIYNNKILPNKTAVMQLGDQNNYYSDAYLHTIWTNSGIISGEKEQFNRPNYHSIVLGTGGREKCSFYEYGYKWDFYQTDTNYNHILKNEISDGCFWGTGQGGNYSSGIVGRLNGENGEAVLYGDGNIYMRHSIYQGFLTDIMPGMVPNTYRPWAYYFNVDTGSIYKINDSKYVKVASTLNDGGDLELSTWGNSAVPINIRQKVNNQNTSTLTLLDSNGIFKTQCTKHNLFYDDDFQNNSLLSLDGRGIVISSKIIDDDVAYSIILGESGLVVGTRETNKDFLTIGNVNYYDNPDSILDGITINPSLISSNGSLSITRLTYGIRFWLNPPSLVPTHPNVISFGDSNNKWKDIYALNGVIQTSDRNEKNSIVELSKSKAESLIYGLKPQTYMMNSGTSGRIHWGLISQDIEELIDQLNWSSLDFAGFIKSQKVIDEEIDKKTGKIIKESEIIEGEYNYSLRYDEFIAPMIKVIQSQKEEIDLLKEEVKEFKKAVYEKTLI